MNGQIPSVSIVIPAHNSEKWIASVLESCSAQTLPPHEVIVIDDGSSDRTGDVCRSVAPAAHYRKIEQGGVSRARNIGAREASGEWLLFLDSDDILLPHAISRLHAAAFSGSAGVAYGMVLERAAPGALPRLNGFGYCAGSPPHSALNGLYRGVIATPGSALVRKSLHDRAGGFVSGFEPLEDRDYWLKCGLLERVAYCDTVVLDKTWRPASHGSQHAKRIYRSQLAQRALREWCSAHGVSTDILPADSRFVKTALDEAVHWGCREIIPELRQEARLFGIRHPQSFFACLFGCPPAPEWLDEAPRVLHE